MSINIAIDGYSSTGKSTLARELAQSLNYRYIDTGAMYRAVTLYALRKGYIGHGAISDKLLEDVDHLKVEFHFNKELGRAEIYLNDENVEGPIREMEVAREVSGIAAISEVRRFLVKAQQKMADHKRVVMDGRDIGTVVLPHAELKIFVTAREEIRVERRYQELMRRGKKVSKQEVKANLEQRDLMDTTRKDSPLRKADDARLLDNSAITRREQLALVKRWASEVLQREASSQVNP